MSLTERLKKVQENAKLTIDQWFAGLDDVDRDAWVAACVNPAVTNVDLIAVAHDEKVAVGKDAMAAHRRNLGLAR